MPSITRHYLTINGRTVHYRRCGSGPSLLMVHQSPRSSAEYEGLMLQWGAQFTCIAPDTPGFGQSDSLPIDDPDIDDFADALVEFGRELGLQRTAAYGFHSGGIILVAALKRHLDFFIGLAVGGYAVWTPEEKAAFGEAYLPPFVPSDYGEHLIWLWNRILEQSWFFPWFETRDSARLPTAHDDPARVHAVVLEMLDSGDAYRFGYGAVLRADRDIPTPDVPTAPVLVTAYDGDPLQAHINRLGVMPTNWEARKVRTPAEHHSASLAFLQTLLHGDCPQLNEDQDRGFIAVATDAFDGLLHWAGERGSGQLLLHRPGRELMPGAGGIAIDLPGHGLSGRWKAAPPEMWAPWSDVIDNARQIVGASSAAYPQAEAGDPDQLFPSLTPDRFGAYLIRAWGIVRARHFFSPWYQASPSTAISSDATFVSPVALAKEHRALIRATAACEYHKALLQREGN